MRDRRPSEAAVGVWWRLNRAQRAAFDAIERGVKVAGLPPLVWYDVLLELDRAGDAGHRAVELEHRLLFAQSNLSRLLDRMEHAGLVARNPHPEDGRSQLVTITTTGRALRREIWPHYAAGIAEVVGDKLSTDEAETLARLLDKLLDRTPPAG